MIEYKKLSVKSMDISMFYSFDRTQNVNKCWRKINGKWLIKEVSFTGNWTEKTIEMALILVAIHHLHVRGEPK